MKMMKLVFYFNLAQRILDSIIIKIINTENDQVISQHNVKRLSGKHSTTIERSNTYIKIR